MAVSSFPQKFTFSFSVRLPPLELIDDITSRSVLYFARSRLTEFLVETVNTRTQKRCCRHKPSIAAPLSDQILHGV
jgi:hypothetical protein